MLLIIDGQALEVAIGKPTGLEVGASHSDILFPTVHNLCDHIS